MTLHIQKVRTEQDADHLAIKIHLFRGSGGKACGWYVGPPTITGDGICLPYLPRSREMRADVAVVRAIAAAGERQTPLCLIDPEDLWEPTWRAA